MGHGQTGLVLVMRSPMEAIADAVTLRGVTSSSTVPQMAAMAVPVCLCVCVSELVFVSVCEASAIASSA